MKLIVGLGNPGDKYKFTRHNAGFMVLDYIAYNNNFEFNYESKFNAEIAKTIIENQTVLLAKPHTFMNLSGQSLIAIMNFYKINKDDILIIYDDLALPIGKMRFRAKGSDGGHNGIKSIIKVLGNKNDFSRLKIGIGPQPPIPAEAFVLQNFTEEQLTELKPILKDAKSAIELYLSQGINIAQSKFN